MTRIDRRTLLRGLGAAIALPLLDGMIPTKVRAEDAPPRRLVSWFLANGRVRDQWRPSRIGASYDLPYCLEGLADVKQHVRVISGLDGPDPAIIPGLHEIEGRSLLSSADLATASFGPSLDHVLAQTVGQATAIPLLVLTSEPAPICDLLSCNWRDFVTFDDAGQPYGREREPAAVFQRLFGSGADGPRSLAQRAAGASLLDAVREDAATLRVRLSAADRRRVDEHLDGIRAIERKLSFPDRVSCGGAWTAPTPTDPGTHIDQMSELVTLALACDRTRLVTFMPAVAASERYLPELATITHHLASHVDLPAAAAYMRWYVARYAHLVARLAATEQADGTTLLDSTFVFGVGGIGDGPTHDRVDVPCLLAGRGGGAPTLEGHVLLRSGTPMAQLHRALLAHFGADRAWGTLGTKALAGLDAS